MVATHIMQQEKSPKSSISNPSFIGHGDWVRTFLNDRWAHVVGELVPEVGLVHWCIQNLPSPHAQWTSIPLEVGLICLFRPKKLLRRACGKCAKVLVVIVCTYKKKKNGRLYLQGSSALKQHLPVGNTYISSLDRQIVQQCHRVSHY